MADINNKLKKLKPCPFCGRQPQIIDYSVNTDGYSEIRLQCCMEFFIRSEIDTFRGYDSRGREITYNFTGESPIDIWNTRHKVRRKTNSSKEKK